VSIYWKEPLLRRLSQEAAKKLLVEALEVERSPRLWRESDGRFARCGKYRPHPRLLDQVGFARHGSVQAAQTRGGIIQLMR
jgi:hypothetical protein